MIRYDDTNLQKLYAEMSPKQRRLILRPAFRQAGGRVKNVACRNLRGSGINNAEKLGRGIRVVILEKDTGFSVTVKPLGTYIREQAPKWSKQKRRKWVLYWAATGTKRRRTRYFRKKRRKRSLNRGRMNSYGFMEKTENQVKRTIPEDLGRDIDGIVKKIARKYGCS